jgi:hypothetical protein
MTERLGDWVNAELTDTLIYWLTEKLSNKATNQEANQEADKWIKIMYEIVVCQLPVKSLAIYETRNEVSVTVRNMFPSWNKWIEFTPTTPTTSVSLRYRYEGKFYGTSQLLKY